MDTLPTLLPLDTARLAVHRLADKIDTRRPTSVHTRTLKDGTTKRIVRRGARKVVDGAKTLMTEVILPMLQKEVKKVLKRPLLFAQLVTDTGIQVPRLEVTGEQLAERRLMCARTCRNYLKQLKEHGFIVAYKFRGRKNSFWLWVNPCFVWVTPAEGLKTASAGISEGPSEASFSGQSGNNFPPTEFPAEQETQKVKVVRVDKKLSGTTGNPLLETEGCNGAPADAQASKTRHRGRAAARAEREAQVAGASSHEARTARVGVLRAEFWALAKLLLYPSQRFSAHQEVLALKAIYRGVYEPALRGQPVERWDRIHQALLERLRLVRMYLQLHPDKFCALPFAEMIPGRGYFDAENRNGFEATRLWLARKQNRPKGGMTLLDKALQLALTEIRQRLALDRGERLPACDNAKCRDVTTLYWHHYTTLRRLGGEEALYVFASHLSLLGMTAPAGA